MPINKKDYPPNWDAIAKEVKTAAGWQCEWCGAKHKSIIQRKENGQYVEVLVVWEQALQRHVDTEKLSAQRLQFHGLTKIILTTAHLDRSTKNNAMENLAALCQRCHLSHDILQHVANRRYGRDHSKDHQLKLQL